MQFGLTASGLATHFQRMTLVLTLIALSLGIGVNPATVDAQSDLTVPYFATVASGLVPDDGADTAIAIARFDLDVDQSTTESFSELDGFVIAIAGQIAINTDDNVVAILDPGDARWLGTGPAFTIQSIGGPATYWRAVIGPEANGQDLGGENAYTFIYGASGDTTAGSLFPWVVKLAVVPANTSVALGSSEENVAYVLALSGSVDVDGKQIEAGEYISPFFGDPGLTTGSEPALVGYIARSAPVSISD